MEKLSDYNYCNKLKGDSLFSIFEDFWRFEYVEDENGADFLMPRDVQGPFIKDIEKVEAVVEGLCNFLVKYEQEDIGDINDRLLERRKEMLDNISNKKSGISESGLVYLLKSIQDDPVYKIGVTTNIDKRLPQIATKLPFEVALEHKIKHDSIYELESELHNKFSDKRLNGEWFRLEDKDVKYIKSL